MMAWRGMMGGRFREKTIQHDSVMERNVREAWAWKAVDRGNSHNLVSGSRTWRMERKQN